MWFNPNYDAPLRSPLNSLVSTNMMLMTFTGRKSSKSYTISTRRVSGDAEYVSESDSNIGRTPNPISIKFQIRLFASMPHKRCGFSFRAPYCEQASHIGRCKYQGKGNPRSQWAGKHI